MASLEDKNRQIQQMKFSSNNPQREEEAYKLTKIIVQEIDRKYKQTINQLIAELESIEGKYKKKLKTITDEVMTMREAQR
jgi:hypothetical protein